MDTKCYEPEPCDSCRRRVVGPLASLRPWPGRAKPLAAKLTAEEVVTLQVLKRKGQSNSRIAQALDVTEAAVRYHLRRQGTPDGRKNKPRKADALADVIDRW